MEPTPESTPSNDSQLWGQTPDRLPDGASDPEPGGGEVVETEPQGWGFICIRTDAHVFPEEGAKCLEKQSIGGEMVHEGTILFNSVGHGELMLCTLLSHP